jgi:hypothetical protein
VQEPPVADTVQAAVAAVDETRHGSGRLVVQAAAVPSVAAPQGPETARMLAAVVVVLGDSQAQEVTERRRQVRPEALAVLVVQAVAAAVVVDEALLAVTEALAVTAAS